MQFNVERRYLKITSTRVKRQMRGREILQEENLKWISNHYCYHMHLLSSTSTYPDVHECEDEHQKETFGQEMSEVKV